MGSQYQAHNERDILNFLTTRPSRPSDDEAIGAFLVDVFQGTYSEKLPSALLNQARTSDLKDVSGRRHGGGVWVLELGYKIVGTFSLLRPESPLSDAWLPQASTLRCVAVERGYHGLGFSELILMEAERVAREWNTDWICLHVQQGANGVARLYEKFGYKRDPRGDGKFMGSWVEGYHLRISTKPIALVK